MTSGDRLFVTSPQQRSGLLVAIITGGRPKLKQRPTARFIADLKAAGVGDVVWVVSDKDAPGYERDGAALAIYPHEWAYEYARSHWMRVEQPDPDGFYGAFPGREWACLEAERRGFWGVLQLDDNIDALAYMKRARAGFMIADANGGMGLFADLLAAVALSTNAATVGAQLGSVASVNPRQVVRPGFPYSCFIEKIGPDREHWYGPYEDDITHSFQYGDRADGVTAAVMPILNYHKEPGSKTGMRAKYDSTRSVQLQRMVPQSASIGIKSARSNGQGEPRVFHHMAPGAIRNPVTVHDAGLYDGVKARLASLTREWFQLEREANRDKVRERIHRHQAKTA